VSQLNADTFFGDLSAVIMKNLPLWAQFYRTPHLDIALLENFEEKIEKMARATIDSNMTGISGVPTWNILLFKRILGNYREGQSIGGLAQPRTLLPWCG
jgi:hypothetical protein